jgi:hypothetical protein
MRTSPDCLACFAKQAAWTVGLATDSRQLQEEVLARSAGLIAAFDLELSPPENAAALYRLLGEATGCPDIFADLKSISNRTALRMLPDLEELTSLAPDPLRTAALLAIAGNVIDYGAHHAFDIQRTVDQCLRQGLAIDDLDELRTDLRQARNILYLGDNCGELVFDRLLIKQFNRPVTLAVKDKPILNDALLRDAAACGLDGLCGRIISNGTACPGTPLPSCSDEFKQVFRESDLIISKGQGNFETLSETAGPIYFLLMVKCEVVARHLAELAMRPTGALKNGDLVLMKKKA